MSKQQQERHFQERHPSMFIRLRLALVFALVILMVSFGYYYLHVQRKSDYLTSRNFRLLTSMGKRIESSVRGQTRALKNLSEKKDFMTAVRDEKKHEQRKNEILRVLAPQFEYVELRDEKAPLAKA